MITAMAFTVYPVSDMQRAKEFYAGVLGLRETYNYRELARTSAICLILREGRHFDVFLLADPSNA